MIDLLLRTKLWWERLGTRWGGLRWGGQDEMVEIAALGRRSVESAPLRSASTDDVLGDEDVCCGGGETAGSVF